MAYQDIVRLIPQLSSEERARLIRALADSLLAGPIPGLINQPEERHSLLELEGLGKEIWEGIDAQEYVNGLRDEWDHRP